VVPTSVHKLLKTPKWVQKEGENSKKRPLFVEGVLWLNLGVLIGYVQNAPIMKGTCITAMTYLAMGGKFEHKSPSYNANLSREDS
jgi:hypothetical protein